MKNRLLPTGIAGLLLLLQPATALPAVASGGKPLLLLADADTAGTRALEAALVAAGYDVTRVLPEYTWNGTNPSLEGFNCVVHLNGQTWATPLPVAAQTALVEFVRRGGGFVGSQWNGYERAIGQQIQMNDLVLQLWPHPDNCIKCNMSWFQVPGQEAHPLLAGIPESFAFFADGHDAHDVAPFTQDPPAVLMTSARGGPAVIIREFEAGRVVNFASAANTTTDLTLQDLNIQTLYLNAVAWACPAALNQPPMAQCQQVEIRADEACQGFVAASDVDNGSTDPDGDPVSLALNPPGPYSLGENPVTLTVTDERRASDSCAATVKVVDATPPVPQCNAPATIVPPDAPISFTATASDNCASVSGVSVEVTGFECFFINGAGKRIDRTESCRLQINGGSLTIANSGGVGNRMAWRVRAIDGSGNLSEEVTCAVEVVNPGRR